MELKLGLSTWSLLDLDVYSAVRVIGDAGIEYIELWGEMPHAYPSRIDMKLLQDTLSSYDMTISAHAPFTDLNPASPDQLVRGAIQKVLEGFVESCAGLGAAMVTVHPGGVHSELLVKDGAASSRETIQKMVRAADGRLSINIENQTKSSTRYHHPLASTLDALVEMLAEVDGTKCTFDTGHAHASGLDPLTMFDRVGGKLAEVHLSDNAGKTDEHLVPGEGTAPLREFMRKVARTEALVCLELNPQVYSKDQVLGGFQRAKQMFA